MQKTATLTQCNRPRNTRETGFTRRFCPGQRVSKITGAEWSVNKAHAKSRVRLCFANLSHEEINLGVATLAGICCREFGVP